VSLSPWVLSSLALVLVGCRCSSGQQWTTFPSGGGACVSQPMIELTYCMEHAGLKAARNRLEGKLKVGGVGEVEAVKETAVEFSQTDQHGALDTCLRDFHAARGLPPPSSAGPGFTDPAAPSHANAGPEFLLFDPDSKATGAERVRQQIDPREATVALRLIFPRFLENKDGCRNEEGGSLEEQRATGSIAPVVQSVADGSFTGAGKTERLYTINVGECQASHAEGWGSVLLAVVRDGTVVARAIVHGGTSTHSVVDVNGDGRDELLLTGGGTAMGTIVVLASLEAIGPSSFLSSGLMKLHDFGVVYENTCGGVTRPEDRLETSRAVVARRSSTGEVSFSTTTRKNACK